MSFLLVHSLTEQKLLKALELGGFPLPSVAVITPNTEFNNFGNITFIIKPEVLDPKEKKNLFYDRDIFSQRIPEIFFDVNKKELYKIYEYLYNKEDKIESFFNLQDIDSLTRKNSNHIQERLEENFLIKEEYFKINNKEYLIPLKDKKIKSLLSNDKYFTEFLILNDIKLNEEFKEIIFNSLKNTEIEYTKLLGEDISKSLIDDFVNDIFYLVDNEYKFKNNEMNMTHNPTIRKILDDKILLTGQNKEINIDEYKKDIQNFIYSDKGKFIEFLYNNYTSKIFSNPHFKNGNKKIEYSLLNIEKLMLKQKTVGVEDISDSSIGKLSSKFAKQFKSFQDIEDNLHLISDKEERFENKDILNKELFNLTDKIFSYYDGSSHLNAKEDFSNSLINIKNKDYFIKSLQSNGFNIKELNNDFYKDCLSFMERVSQLENHYFEGKPQKTLYLEDFKAVLLPNNSSKILIDLLKDKVKIHFYDKNNLDEKYKILKDYEFKKPVKKLIKNLTN